MMSLLYQELLIQHRVYHLIKYIFIFLVFCLISTSLISAPEELEKLGVALSVIYIPLMFLGLVPNIIRQDLDDGSLELLLTNSLAIKIITAKFLVLSANAILSFVAILPLIALLFNIELIDILVLLAVALILVVQSAALIILIAAIQSYFKSNTNFFAIMIMPLIIPNIILAGILIAHNGDMQLLTIMSGIDLVILPPCLFLASYLVENIYNI